MCGLNSYDRVVSATVLVSLTLRLIDANFLYLVTYINMLNLILESMIIYFHNGLDIKVGTLPLFLAILAISENRHPHLIDSTPFPKFRLVIARTFVTLKTEGNKI